MRIHFLLKSRMVMNILSNLSFSNVSKVLHNQRTIITTCIPNVLFICGKHMKPCDTKRCCCSELTHSRKHRREPVKQTFANINIPDTKSKNEMSQGSRRSERLANQVQILITQSLWAFSLIIQGKERQNACIHPEWPAEPWKEEGAGGRIQHTGNFTFINDISAIIAFHPKQKITENTEYLKRMTVSKDI